MPFVYAVRFLQENIVLDLSNPGDFPIEYDESGLWADVFNNDAIVYSQEFMFSHASPYSNYSNGFFASKVTAISGIGRYR